MTDSADFRLQLTDQEMRAFGYRVVDTIIDHFCSIRGRPASGVIDIDQIKGRLTEPVPECGEGFGAVLEQLERDVWDQMSHLDHPRCFAHVPSPSNFVSAMADALAADKAFGRKRP